MDVEKWNGTEKPLAALVQSVGVSLDQLSIPSYDLHKYLRRVHETFDELYGLRSLGPSLPFPTDKSILGEFNRELLTLLTEHLQPLVTVSRLAGE